MKKEFEKEQSDNQIDDAFLDMPDMEDDEKQMPSRSLFLMAENLRTIRIS